MHELQQSHNPIILLTRVSVGREKKGKRAKENAVTILMRVFDKCVSMNHPTPQILASPFLVPLAYATVCNATHIDVHIDSTSPGLLDLCIPEMSCYALE